MDGETEKALARAELEHVTFFCAPLCWHVQAPHGRSYRNGTAFFVNTGSAVFGVTAAHVIAGWRADASLDARELRLGGNHSAIDLNWDERVIDIHEGLDIATFQVTEREVGVLTKHVLTGSQREWPPLAPTP
jgi:hypothetical protein